MELTIRGLTKDYGKKRALTEFTYTFTPGIYAILGPNGAGKTTLMHLICDIVSRTSGEICCDGRDILKLGSAFRKKLGFMPQSQGMYEDMSAYGFLTYMARLKEIKRQDAAKQIDELLRIVNLESVAHKKVGSFSGGMRQRVMLAQALLGAPEVLILDEPTAGLDPEERVRLRNHIAALSREKIVLLTTHITGDIESIADQVLLMRGGRLLLSAAPEEFIARSGCTDLESAYIRLLHEGESA